MYTNRQTFLDQQKERKFNMNFEFETPVEIDHAFFISECAKYPGCVGCPLCEHGATATIQRSDGEEVGTLICNTGVEKLERDKENESEKV